MRKFLIVILSIMLALSFTACGGDEPAEEEPVDDTAIEEPVEDEPIDEPESEEFFKDNVLQLENYKLEITDFKIVKAGEKGNKYGDEPAIVFYYTVTNFSDESLDASTAWMFVFEAIQDNDPNMVNKLDMAILLDDEYNDFAGPLDKIKIDGSVDAVHGYTLTDLKTPVTLIATSGLLGDEIGQQEFPVN